MNIQHTLKRWALIVFAVIWLPGFAWAQQGAALVQANPADPIIGQIFAQGVPVGYQAIQDGNLSAKEGNGVFLVLGSSGNTTKSVIVMLEKMNWLAIREIESASPVTVGKQMVKRFFPEAMPVTISESRQDKSANQFAAHLRVITRSGATEPAIALRLLYPEGKACVIWLWRQDDTQDFPLAYQQLESQAKGLIDALPKPTTSGPTVSERYVLWRLQHIFKKGVFTHSVQPEPGN